MLMSLTTDQIADLVAEHPQDATLIQFIARNRLRFRNGDIIAWDLGRLINVARLGYSAGYLPDHEALTIIMTAARALQAAFRSWRELSDNYLLGYSVSQGGAEVDQGRAAQAAWLCDGEDSPWQLIPWSLPLGSEAASRGQKVRDADPTESPASPRPVLYN